MTFAIDLPKDKLRDFCKKWKITEFALFGSVTRPEEFRADSDVDVMVTFAPNHGWSLFELVDMREELEAMFGRPVDLLTRRGVDDMLNYIRRESILSSAVAVEVA